MAASDNDPAAEPPAAAGSPAPPPGTAKPLPKSPRVSPPTLAQRREESSGGAAAGAKVSLDDLIGWLRDGASGSKDAQAQQSTLSKEKRKFRRYDPPASRTPDGAGEPGVEAATQASEEDEGAPAGVRSDETAPPVDFIPKGIRRPVTAQRTPPRTLILRAVVLVLMAACFFLGRWTVPNTAPAAESRPAATASGADAAALALSASTLTLLDEAIAAENAGDTRKAFGLFDQLKSGKDHVYGLDYQLGWLDFQTGNTAAAAVALNQSIAAGEDVSECYGLRGLIRSQIGPIKPLHDFETAAKASPFEADGFFHWGEALRRAGKPREALVHLREAVERAPTTADLAQDQYKVRLTQIELGEEKDFADQLAVQLASPKPAMEWLLTAAAEDMHNENYVAAAADLDRARQSADPALFALAIRDYFFTGYAEKEPIKKIYAETFQPRATAPANAGTSPSAMTAAGNIPVAFTSPGAGVEASPSPAATP